MKEEIILIGGGGHCKACIDVIETEGRFKIAGIIDIEKKLHQKVLDYEIMASDEDLPSLAKNYKNFFITIGQIKSPNLRVDKFRQLKKLNVNMPVIVSPRAVVSKYAKIDEGTIIMHNALVNTNVVIGKNCIVNSGALIEHDVTIGDHCHISTGTIINGECIIGEMTFIGSNTVINNSLHIVENTTIGSGSIVISTIKNSGTYIGGQRLKTN